MLVCMQKVGKSTQNHISNIAAEVETFRLKKSSVIQSKCPTRNTNMRW